MTTNKSVQAERRALAGSSATSTFFREATKSRTLSGGSYEAERDLVVAGESAATLYPRLPDSSPWSSAGAQVPNEEPTNIDINAQEPCGTFAEVLRSEFANSEPNTASQHQMIDDCVGGVGDPAPAGATPAARAATPPADPVLAGSLPLLAASSPANNDRGGVVVSPEAHARLGELLDRGLVRGPQVKRRRV